jgi:hypothetical protein
MGSVPLRICRILEHLHSVQTEITLLADEEVGGGPNRPRMEDSELQALRTVGLSVDHLRQVLRAYIEFATSNKGLADVEEFYSLRAERTMQILRFACIGLQTREGKPHDHPYSLFEELMKIAFDAVDRAGGPAELPGKIFASQEIDCLFETVAAVS